MPRKTRTGLGFFEPSKTEDGHEQPYEVWSSIQQRLTHASKDDAVVLLVDEENKVADVAFVPSQK
jgi:hypothetical protein